MGCCSSKTNPSSVSFPKQTQNPHPQNEPRCENNVSKLSAEIASKEVKEPEEKLGFKKKEVFVIHHRRNHDRRSETKASSSDSDGSSIQPASYPDLETANPKTPLAEASSNIMAMAASGAAVRTSSCTKEEVDAILIQCGRLSRSSSGKGPFSGSARKYSGSKRSHDFDRENEISTDLNCDNNGDVDDDNDERQMRRQSRGSHRRRTPSRSRERDPQAQRSGSRERPVASRSGSRRVSRSPGRRSKSPVTKSGNVGNSANSSGSTTTSNSNGVIRPGKMVSVPATVSIEKNTNNGGNGDCHVKRVLVRRNVGEGLAASRGGTPPRSRSPAARSNAVDASVVKEAASLSRSNSRKAEHSPYRRTPLNEIDRRTPLNEIDMSSLPFQPLANRANSVKGQQRSSEIAEVMVKQQPVNVVSQDKLDVDLNKAKGAVQLAEGCRSRGSEAKDTSFEQLCESKREQLKSDASVNPSPPLLGGQDAMKLPLTLTRSRSSRRSRDLDINVEALLNPNPATNYNLLLLQDIQNFHQKTNSTCVSSEANPNAKTPFSLPECLSKVSSIVDAVADLNSSTKPNLTIDGKKRLEKSKVPFMDSEVNDEDDAVEEPSMHKYVTVRKRGSGVESYFQGGDFDELESSGSNSYTSGSRQHCISSSSWEPNSADSTDRWTSSSRSRQGVSPVTLERHAFSNPAFECHEDPQRNLSSNHGTELLCNRSWGS